MSDPIPPGYVADEPAKIYAYHTPSSLQIGRAEDVAALALAFRNDLEDLLGDAPDSDYGSGRAAVIRQVNAVCEQAMLLVLRPPVHLPGPPDDLSPPGDGDGGGDDSGGGGDGPPQAEPPGDNEPPPGGPQS